VLTRPDRPAGRGLHAAPSAVKRLALERGLPLLQPATLEGDAALERLGTAQPDALVVAAYGLILPPALLAAAPHGALNIHASLLPRWRGAAPIQRALLAGDAESGVSIMQMDAGLDSGPLLAQRRIPILPEDDAQSLHDRLAALGAEMILAALAEVAAGRARATPQPATGVTYAHKLARGEAVLDWARPAVELERRVRALRPAPGAQSLLRGERIKILGARLAAGAGAPGEVLGMGPAGIVIACGQGALAATELQRAGGRRLAAAEFVRGFPVARGERLGAAR